MKIKMHLQLIGSNFILLLLIILSFNSLVFSEVIYLKSGEKIEGKIIEKADKYIKVNIEGTPVTYFNDDIDKIEDSLPYYPKIITPLENNYPEQAYWGSDYFRQRRAYQKPKQDNTAKARSEVILRLHKEGELEMKRIEGLKNRMREAVFESNMQKALEAIKDGAGVNNFFGSGNSLLCRAVEREDIEMIKLLLAHGANASIKDTSFNGNTPLHRMCLRKGETVVEIARLLIEHGADVNAKDYSGNTPLMALSGQYGGASIEIAELLFGNGADVNSINNQGETPLLVTIRYFDKTLGRKDLIRLLIQKGANVNYREPRGHTVFMVAAAVACWRGDGEIIKMLISAGADVNARDKQGKTALTQLEELKLEELKLHLPNAPLSSSLDKVISLLKAHGAKN